MQTLRSAFASLLFVTRCNISFGARGFRSAAPAIWNSLSSNVCLATHLSAHSFSTIMLYKSIYLLTYLHFQVIRSVEQFLCDSWASCQLSDFACCRCLTRLYAYTDQTVSRLENWKKNCFRKLGVISSYQALSDDNSEPTHFIQSISFC